jgi:nitrogen fixation-related uncharacterized protein
VVSRRAGRPDDEAVDAVGSTDDSDDADDDAVGAVRRPRRPWPPDEGAGEAILRGNGWATLVFAVASIAAAVAPDPLEYVAVPVDLVLFVVGCSAFLWAYAVAIGRSRYDDLTMAGVFFLSDRVAPARVTRTFRVLLAVQVVVAVATAAARPFTALAFGVLVPVLGLGLMALWGARHGVFPAKQARPGGP